MILERAPRPTTRSCERADLLKDGEIVAEEQYFNSMQLACILLTELKPENKWTIRRYFVDPTPELDDVF